MYELEENFRILRVTVESHTALPAVFAVSSALRQDGATYVACGLARAFAEAGHATLLVEANADSSIAAELGITGLTSRPGVGLGTRVDELENLSVASLGSGPDAYKGNLAQLVGGMRAAYRVVIFDAAPIPKSGSAIELAREADGVVLACKLGRHPDVADKKLLQLLGENRSRLIGVVPTSARRRSRRATAVAIPTVTDVPLRSFRSPKGVEVVS